MRENILGTELMSKTKFFSDYSRFNEETQKYETWEEAVQRVMNMHRNKFAEKMSPELSKLLDFAQEHYTNKNILGAQRALQFGGEQLLDKNARMYNCTSTWADRVDVFQKIFWLLLCGSGVGFSVQNQHVTKLPPIQNRREKKSKVFIIPDSIEGWADAVGVLMSSYFVGGGTFPEYEKCKVLFDYSQIRPKGSPISGGFKAPGPDGLRQAIQKIEMLIDNFLSDSKEPKQLTPIVIYDTIMHISDAVLSGGVRRSATICMFSKDDEEMLNAKTGNWFHENPQRARSNNSVMLLRDDVTKEEFGHIMQSVKDAGEPGFIFTDVLDFAYNPCVTGDAVIKVKDHGGMINGEVISDGVEYEMTLKDLVELYEFDPSNAPTVLSYNTETGKKEYKQLLGAALTRKNTEIIQIEYGDKTIKVTPDHLVLTKNRGYVEAKDLAETDKLVISNNETAEIKFSEVSNEDVYDISVKDNHNFYANDIVVHNCVEVGMLPKLETGESGFQMCNLTEINGAHCYTREQFLDACKAASILGTIQAGYTSFDYLGDVTEKIVEREALIGVGITGWMNNPDVLFDEQNMIDGAETVKKYNKIVADLIGINQAARTTVVKPSGNASVILGSASGIHGEHAPRFIRHVQMNEQDPILQAIRETNPKMVFESIWSNTGTDYAVAFPIEPSENSIFKKDLMGVKQLVHVKKAQQFWIERGTNKELCTDDRIRHNVSNTISVDDWDEVEKYIYENRDYFAGVSLLSAMGDKAYPQAPFTEVLTPEQILEMYGTAGIFASGLIVDGLHAFGGLWVACDTVNGWGLELDPEGKEDLLKRDWVRRARKFADNYFDGDVLKMTNCLKDSHNLHKYESIVRSMKDVNFNEFIKEKAAVEVDTLGAAACSGGACEIEF